jgi:hypothetical protein
MEDLQPADLGPALDFARGEPKLQELPPSQDSVLTTGYPRRLALSPASVVALTTHMVVDAPAGSGSPLPDRRIWGAVRPTPRAR